MPLLLKANQDSSPNQEIIQRAGEIIVAGGVVAFPTETVYGLAALASQHEAVERVYLLKDRSLGKSLSILVADPTQLQEWVETIPTEAHRLMKRFWPGPLTLVFHAGKHLPAILTAGTGKIGVRISSHPVAHALVLAVGAPITATSANTSGASSCRSAKEVLSQLGSNLEVVLDVSSTGGAGG